MMRPALVLACAVLSLSCAHPAPRGPVATTPAGSALTPRLESCADAAAPYLAELCAMKEPSLSTVGPETYRFVWMRHHHNPVAVRLNLAKDAVSVVSVQSDAHDPANARRHEFTAAADAWNALLIHLQAADFWNMPGDPEEDQQGLDGADWIIEGRRGGVYHSVVRWEPKPGPFREACEDFIKLSGLTFPAEIR
jgi:hypothetical protein